MNEEGTLSMDDGTKLGRQFSKSLTTAIKTAVYESRDRILLEIAQTKELYTLLNRWGSGDTLTDDEKLAVKTQLIDICKAIPALAIFMLPFGSLVLVFLIKFLPFSILPTSFSDVSDELRKPPAVQSKTLNN